jgi:hypothetical protein
MPKSNKRTPASYHDEQTVTEALMSLALEGGNVRAAARRIAQLGHKVHAKTITRWRDEFPDRYDEVRQGVLKDVEERAAQRHDSLAERNMAVHEQALDRLGKELPTMDGKEIGRVVQPTAIAAGVHRDKAAKLRGENPAVVVNVSLKDTVLALAGQGAKFFDAEGRELTPEKVIEGTATEEPDDDKPG